MLKALILMMLLNLNRKQNPHKKASESTRPEFYNSGRFLWFRKQIRLPEKNTERIKKMHFFAFFSRKCQKTNRQRLDERLKIWYIKILK